jgi:hypothetical protein
MHLNNVKLVKEDDLLDYDNRLKLAKESRPKMEYFYCFTANLIKYVLDTFDYINSISYIDADMYFFQPLDVELEKFANYDALIVPHNIKDKSHGIYNVCYNLFRNNENGLKILNWWSNKTLESTELGNGIWGDQKYLDDFPILFKNVGVVGDEFAPAPWNVMSYELNLNNKIVSINNNQIISYHFARLLVINSNIFLPIKRTKLNKFIINSIYLPYILDLRKSLALIKKFDENYKVKYTTKNLKALLISALLGRLFFKSKTKFFRLGIDIPLFYE